MGVAAVPRLTIAGTSPKALNRLDQEILTRSRTTNGIDATKPGDSDDEAGSRSWPPVLVITEPPQRCQAINAVIRIETSRLGRSTPSLAT